MGASHVRLREEGGIWCNKLPGADTTLALSTL